MPEQRAITSEEQRCILTTSETPGFRLLCDLLQAEIDFTLTRLEETTLTPAEENRLLSFFRVYRRILFHFKFAPKQIQLALRREVDPDTTAALFTPGAADDLEVTSADLWDEDPLAPRNDSNTGVVVE